MGSTSIKSSGSQTQTVTPTAAEQEMENLQLAQYKQLQPAQTQLQQQALGMGSQLMSSFQNPNSQQWQSLIGGVTPEQQQTMIKEQQRQLNPQFQANGIYDSGLAYTASLRAATDLSNQNSQFNVGALQNALNMALGGQAQVQAPVSQGTSQLASQLAGLRTVNTQSQQTQTQNPFLQSFYSSLGQGLGNFTNPQTYTSMFKFGSCWVAAEIFGGWFEPKTCSARYYIGNIAPTWFRKFYYENGERIAKFIHNKPILKAMLRPLFEYFAWRGKVEVKCAY